MLTSLLIGSTDSGLVNRMKRISLDDIDLGPVLGTGTVGTVYQGIFNNSGTEVAIKILQPAISQDALIRKRFRREMEILGRLEHPHIIRYFGGGEHDGQLFYAMELLEGGNVRDLLERYGSFSWQEVASIGRQVSAALQYAHNYGVIHRDLKPGNLFLDTDATVKLGDFGIARDTTAADITSQGITVGTHAYMAPEQIKGAKIDGKTDLYSLGCVLFELVVGKKPFEGTNFAVLFEQHLHSRPALVTEFVPDCPPAMADIIRQLLNKDPEARPFNARAVQGVMNELLASDGAKAEGVHVLEEPSKRQDVGAAAVVDPGMASLVRKLRPEERREVSWVAIATILIAASSIIALASILGR